MSSKRYRAGQIPQWAANQNTALNSDSDSDSDSESKVVDSKSQTSRNLDLDVHSYGGDDEGDAIDIDIDVDNGVRARVDGVNDGNGDEDRKRKRGPETDPEPTDRRLQRLNRSAATQPVTVSTDAESRSRRRFQSARLVVPGDYGHLHKEETNGSVVIEGNNEIRDMDMEMEGRQRARERLRMHHVNDNQPTNEPLPEFTLKAEFEVSNDEEEEDEEESEEESSEEEPIQVRLFSPEDCFREYLDFRNTLPWGLPKRKVPSAVPGKGDIPGDKSLAKTPSKILL